MLIVGLWMIIILQSIGAAGSIYLQGKPRPVTGPGSTLVSLIVAAAIISVCFSAIQVIG
jgi:hypothetical protein